MLTLRNTIMTKAAPKFFGDVAVVRVYPAANIGKPGAGTGSEGVRE